MAKTFMMCERGQRVKDGRVTHPADCPNRASGVFKVSFKRGHKIMLLCADCAFYKVPNRVRIIIPDEGNPIYYRDVEGIDLIYSITTQFVQENAPRREGDKHWVEPVEKPVDRSRYTIEKQTSKKKVLKGKDMDLKAYINTLRRHDDGK